MQPACSCTFLHDCDLLIKEKRMLYRMSVNWPVDSVLIIGVKCVKMRN